MAFTSSNATPKTLGEELVRLRTAAGVSREQIAEETKVSNRILGALESGHYRHLPEKIFCRNFIRQYAQMVGAEPQPLLDALDQAWERHMLASGMFPALLEVTGRDVRQPIRWRFWVPMGIGVLVLAVVGLFILQSSPGTADLQPDPRRSAAVRPSPTSALPIPIRDTPKIGPVLPAGDEGATDGRALAITIAVRSGRECWFHVRDGAGVQEQRLLGSGGQAELELEAPVKLTLGNAGAVTLVVDGEEFLELGRLGQVVHLEITGGGVVPLAGSLPNHG